jgi:hypothetical protein
MQKWCVGSARIRIRCQQAPLQQAPFPPRTSSEWPAVSTETFEGERAGHALIDRRIALQCQQCAVGECASGFKARQDGCGWILLGTAIMGSLRLDDACAGTAQCGAVYMFVCENFMMLGSSLH